MSVLSLVMYMELDKRPDPVVSENEELEKMMKDRMLHTITMLRKRTDLSTEDACYLASLYLVEYVFEDLDQVEEDCMERWIDEKNLEPAEEGKINEAENELYMGMVEDDVDYLELALTFYLYLNDMDGDFLDDNGYSREEVLEGMKDLASDWGVTGLEAF